MKTQAEVLQALANVENDIAAMDNIVCTSEQKAAYAQLPKMRGQVEAFTWVLEGEQPAPLADAALAELEQLNKQASSAPWYAVGQPWGKGNWVNTAEDPHAGRMIADFDTDITRDASHDEDDADVNNAHLTAAMRNALPGLLARLRAAEARAFPETLTPELDYVLGRPNFWCGPFAHIFQAAGYDIPKKAEREQAFILHWLTGLVLKHGAAWNQHASTELAALKDKLAVKGGQANAND
jgi:hypothetical protein